jgi:hypothetical protein
MKSPKVRSFNVRQLARLVDQGRFAVPKLQREFVWTGPKAVKLLDSIYRQMPVGTLVIWRTQSKFEALLRKSHGVLPPFDQKNREILFLIDGQQRLSVIHRVMEGGVIRNATGAEVDFRRVTFDVGHNGEPGDSIFQYRLPVDHEYVSLADVLATRWKYKLRDLPQYKLKRVQECRERILNYKMPVLEVASNDLEEVRELFIRINTQGMRIGSADAAFARAARFDLRERAQELRQHLPAPFRRVPYETILQALAFVEGVEDVGERAYATVIRDWDQRLRDDSKGNDGAVILKTWNRLRRAFESAVEYLGTYCYVVDETILPSNNMLAALSVYFFHHPGQPRGRARDEIRKWFWATGVGKRYSGRGYRENLKADCEFFRRLARSGGARFHFVPITDRSDIRRAEYNRRTSLTDAFFCLLLAQQPRFFANGERMPSKEVASRANRDNKHHIFPKAQLMRLSIPARDYNSICNICLVSADENQDFGSKQPKVYLDEVRRRRHFRRTLDSHLIPQKATGALLDSSLASAFRLFKMDRQTAIARAFESAAGVKLFRPE